MNLRRLALSTGNGMGELKGEIDKHGIDHGDTRISD